MKESTEKTEPKVKPKDSKLKEFVKENSKIVLGVIIGVLIMTAGLAVAAGVTTSNKSKKPSSQQETSNNYDNKSSDNVKQQNTDASQAPSTGGTSTNGGSTSSNNSSNATPVAPSPPPAPSSVSYAFFAGTYTPQFFHNYPKAGVLGIGNISGTLNAQGYVNLRLSWNKTADIQLRVEGSNNGTSWVDYYQYYTSSGSITVPVNAAYYRVFAYVGNCTEGLPCEGPEVDALVNTPYNLNFSGLLTK